MERSDGEACTSAAPIAYLNEETRLVLAPRVSYALLFYDSFAERRSPDSGSAAPWVALPDGPLASLLLLEKSPIGGSSR